MHVMHSNTASLTLKALITFVADLAFIAILGKLNFVERNAG